jgi:hypothetical protein
LTEVLQPHNHRVTVHIEQFFPPNIINHQMNCPSTSRVTKCRFSGLHCQSTQGTGSGNMSLRAEHVLSLEHLFSSPVHVITIAGL